MQWSWGSTITYRPQRNKKWQDIQSHTQKKKQLGIHTHSIFANRNNEYPYNMSYGAKHGMSAAISNFN